MKDLEGVPERERRSHKASFTHSPLANSRKEIHKLAGRIQDYLHFPDPSPLYAVMGAIAAAHMTGPPVWLMMIGPASCGKTELLKTTFGLPGLLGRSSIKNSSALLSGTSKREIHPEAHGGLLRELGDKGILVFKDFTSLLSGSRDDMRELFGAFREVYDGEWSRSIGAEGARTISWQGRLTLLAGCTNEIDRHHQTLASMGERFIYYRYRTSEGRNEAYRALTVDDPEAAVEQMRDAVVEFFSNIDLLDPHKIIDPRHLTSSENERFIAMGQFTAHARTSVHRDQYSHEVTDVSEPELPSRLTREFSQLYRSMEYIGVEPTEALQVIRGIALDSMPLVRRLCIASVMAGAVGLSDISESVRVSNTTVARVLEDLYITGILDKTRPNEWALSDWARLKLRDGWGSRAPKAVDRNGHNNI